MQTCLIGHTLSAIFVIPVHSTYSIDLPDSQYLYIDDNANEFSLEFKMVFLKPVTGKREN